MEIKSIEINNVKGIKKLKFELNLIPNKPNIFVAPNGFGKSSFSTAFKSLNSTKLNLNKKDLHDGKDNNLPEIKIVVKKGYETTLIANNKKNDINKELNVFVINSQLIAKSKVMNISGRNIAKTDLEISPNTIIAKIPEKSKFEYLYSDFKKKFGENGKILPNISHIFNDEKIFLEIEKVVEIRKFKLKTIPKKISDFKEKVNTYNGTREEVKKYIEEFDIDVLENIDEIKKISDIVLKFRYEFIKDKIDAYLCAIQLVEILNDLSSLKKAFAYNEYLKKKEHYLELLKDMDSTRFKIKPKEVKGKGLVIEWPKAYEISNGQRDVLSFVASLITAENTLNKKYNILIIDEVFDYLDEANLISCQYYITKYIERIKNEGREIFPIIMTHLDPNLFNHFCFNKYKIQIRYLKPISNNNSEAILKIIRKREDILIKDNVSKYYFHFHPNTINITDDFKKLDLNIAWGNSEKFNNYIYIQLKKYIKDVKEYDSLAVCIGIRIVLEKKLYEILTKDKKEAFLNEHGTKRKIEFCCSESIDVPEIYCLLGIIYNTTLHLNYINNSDNIITPLKYKLENITIKKIIKTVIEI